MGLQPYSRDMSCTSSEQSMIRNAQLDVLMHQGVSPQPRSSLLSDTGWDSLHADLENAYEAIYEGSNTLDPTSVQSAMLLSSCLSAWIEGECRSCFRAEDMSDLLHLHMTAEVL